MSLWKASLIIFITILTIGVIADISSSPAVPLVIENPTIEEKILNNSSSAPPINTPPANTIDEGSPTQASPPVKKESTFIVERVVDGDTLVLKGAVGQITVRLLGINSPESVDPRKVVECFGKESAEHLSQLVLGKTVLMHTDSTQGLRDKYDRILGYIFLSDQQLINKRMIEEGYAYEYTYQTPYEYQNAFKEAQIYAEKNKLGLWADGACVATTSPSTISEQRPPSANYQCNSNIYSCSDFRTRSEAQAAYDACGGVQNDVHKLDADSDGFACETLP